MKSGEIELILYHFTDFNWLKVDGTILKEGLKPPDYPIKKYLDAAGRRRLVHHGKRSSRHVG